jgi:hypothetical protein
MVGVVVAGMALALALSLSGLLWQPEPRHRERRISPTTGVPRTATGVAWVEARGVGEAVWICGPPGRMVPCGTLGRNVRP